MQVVFIVSIFISSNKWTIYELYPGVGGYVTHPFTWTEVSLADVLRVDCSDGLPRLSIDSNDGWNFCSREKIGIFGEPTKRRNFLCY